MSGLTLIVILISYQVRKLLGKGGHDDESLSGAPPIGSADESVAEAEKRIESVETLGGSDIELLAAAQQKPHTHRHQRRQS